MLEYIFLEQLNSYEGISALLQSCSYYEILSGAAAVLGTSQEQLEKYPMGGYSKGWTSGAYQYVLKDLLENWYHYDWVFNHLADDTSKDVFVNLLRYRILPRQDFLRAAFDAEHRQYFDKSIVPFEEQEVFVDCGGYIGDTAEGFIEACEKYKKIYVYEPLKENVEKCHENLHQYRNIVIKGCGVGEQHKLMYMTGEGSSGTITADGQEGDLTEIISLDEDIQEKVTYIKMDVEGSEIGGILGAKNHIKIDRPKLAICVYHLVSDIWEIPRLISCINPEYQFYMRHYMEDKNWETVIYAVLEEHMKSGENPKALSDGEHKHVVAMAPFERWANVELVKDFGLVPYLLYKNHGCKVSMVGAGGWEYPYAELIKGVQLEFLPDGTEQSKLAYIREHAEQIDCLIFQGCYSTNFLVAELYKQLNPDGRIYCALDANSSWMDRILWFRRDFMEFMNRCDVIATSGRAMQEHLNQKWPWRIEHIPNGYYNFFKDEEKTPVFERKENIILTVGRLGTPQKATHVLLEAFAMIAERIPDWKLRLVGGMEEEFQQYVQQYFERFPALRERIYFTGNILDKQVLFQEYLDAKIFAVTSILEGGTPNVVAEALNAGCVMAVTRIDAYDEIIDGGRCGLSVAINDVLGFAGILLNLCQRADLEQLSAHAYAYGSTHFDMKRIVKRLYKMIFGGEDESITDRG